MSELDEKESPYVTFGRELGELVTSKQKAYGNAFERSADMLKILYPNGVRPDQFVDLLTVARILDKLMRVATDKDAFGEDPFQDIGGYAMLAVVKHRDMKDWSKYNMSTMGDKQE
jgi:hypothetical protein